MNDADFCETVYRLAKPIAGGFDSHDPAIDREDIVQEMAERAVKCRPILEEKLAEGTSGYLARTFKNVGRDLVGHRSKKKKHYRECVVLFSDLPKPRSDPEDGDDPGRPQAGRYVGASAFLLDVHAALATLPPPLGEAVDLVHFQRFTHEEAAERLGITRESVTRRLAQASKALRRELAAYAPRATGQLVT